MKDDPGYQFRLQESTRALERSVSASRGVGSGASAKALARYTQDYASNEFAQARGRALQDYMVGRENYTMGLDSRNQATMNRFGQISGLAAWRTASSWFKRGHGQSVGRSASCGE